MHKLVSSSSAAGAISPKLTDVSVESSSTSNTASDEEYQIYSNTSANQASALKNDNLKHINQNQHKTSKQMSNAEFVVKYASNKSRLSRRTETTNSDNLSTIVSSSSSSNSSTHSSSEVCPFANVQIGDSASNAQSAVKTCLASDNLQRATYCNDSNNNSPSDSCKSDEILIKFASIMYATLLVVLGCVLHVSELRHKSRNSLDHIFCICVALTGFAWLAYLHADLQQYKRFARRQIIEANKQCQLSAKHQLPIITSSASSQSSLMRGAVSLADTELVLRQFALSHKRNKHIQQANELLDKQTIDLQQQIKLPSYKFVHGKLGANFYLKCGMAAFCFGHVVHEGLRFGQYLYFFTAGTSNCQDTPALAAHLVTPLYSFYQLFMMFKYSNLVINRHRTLARFGLMHIIGTSITFWFRTIIEEAFEDFVHKMDYFQSSAKTTNNQTVFLTISTAQQNQQVSESLFCSQNTLLTTKSMNALPYLYPFTIEYNLLLAATFLSLYLNIGKVNDEICAPSSSQASSSSSSVASKTVSIKHHQSLTQKIQHNQPMPTTSSIPSTQIGEYKSNFVVNADCHSATIGLFCGFFVLLVALVTIVIFFVTINKPTHAHLGVKINAIQEATLTGLLLIVTLIGFKKMSHLKRNWQKANRTTIDDVLMLIPLPFFFVHTLLSFRAELATFSTTTTTNQLSQTQNSVLNNNNMTNRLMLNISLQQTKSNKNNNNNQRAKTNLTPNTTTIAQLENLSSFNSSTVAQFSFAQNNESSQNNQDTSYKLFTIILNVLVMVEVVLQTSFIIDGSRRYSESRYMHLKKPGRELVTFAIILNITYWLVATFETKSVEQYKTEVTFYGPLAYMFISHTTLPLMLFYRYHSSVCLAEIWTRAYKCPKSEH